MNTAARQLHRKAGWRDADRNFVEAHAELSLGSNAHIARQQQKRSHRECVTFHEADRREGMRHQAKGELRAGLHHLETAFAIIGRENLEIEARREDVLAPGAQHDDGLVFFRPVERCVEVAQHRGGHHVHLAVVHRDCGDAFSKAIGDTVRHLALPQWFRGTLTV